MALLLLGNQLIALRVFLDRNVGIFFEQALIVQLQGEWSDEPCCFHMDAPDLFTACRHAV
jgi:hypothetical protein